MTRRKKGLRTRWFSPQRVLQVLDRVLRLPPPDQPEALRRLLVNTARQAVPPVLTSPAFDERQHPELRPLIRRLLFLEEQMEKAPCRACGHFSLCHGKRKKAFLAALDDFASWWDSANAVRMRLWSDLVRHLEFLKQEGFVSEQNTLTDDGLWASKLRLDQPLMIAEGLRKGLLPDNDPALLAGVVAPFVQDRDVADERLEPSQVPRDFLKAFKKVQRGLAPLAERKAVQGFEVRPMALWAGTAVYAWSKGATWDRVVTKTGMAEGDLSMLVLRTAENLRQIAALTREYPSIAACASNAIDLIMREPVIMPF
ncbi:MAG: hypothetical protein JRI36_07810 [Deltaproteobacteria bacterium]|nr:hypothetical protein [Deltaproteobacteria bacterium]